MKTQRFRIAGATPLVLGIAALSLLVPGVSASAQDAVPTSSGKWVAQFVGRTGADVRVEPGKKDSESQVRFEVRNAGINKRIAWDIARGVCGDNAQSVVALAKFRVIQTGNDGSGSARVTIPKLESNARYYARMFEPGESVDDRSVQCVNLSETP